MTLSMVNLIDPRSVAVEPQTSRAALSAREIVGAGPGASRSQQSATSGEVFSPDEMTPLELDAAIRADFRVLLTLIWRFLLNCDPSPDQLSMAHYLQHGPQRSIIMAFRGMSKSWITAAFALWLLYCNPQLKILIVSGSLKRAVASTNWCLQLIMQMPLLAHLKPQPHQRQSSLAFDVGPALPDQSPSFHAAGIGGQIVGFRGDFILPDDVETQTNSITVGGREKTREAVKEFDSILKPGGKVKFLGTPHDADSLYTELYTNRGYECRIWPALFPTPEQMKAYGDRLHPYITHKLKKNPALVGTPIQPGRFPLSDLEARRLSLGNSEFALQFMLDTSLSDIGKYPLKFRDLIVMDLDLKRGPEEVVWGTSQRITDLPLLGFAGDYFHAPMMVGDRFSKWSTKTAFIDPSGRGKDETGMTVVGELFGHVGVLMNRGWTDGASPETLQSIAEVCVKYDVEDLEVEDNFGDGMFTSLLRPVVTAAWKKEEDNWINAWRPGDKNRRFGTAIREVKSTNQMSKEKRILAVLEPVTQAHRLIVAREVIEADERSLKKIDGEDTRRAYSLFYQYAHLTRDKDSLKHDDRLESLAGALRRYAGLLGVDPGVVAKRSTADALEEELERLHGEIEELGSGSWGSSSGSAVGNSGEKQGKNASVAALSPCKR